MSMQTTPAESMVPPEIERQLRARGAVIDIAGIKALYAPLLLHQPRNGVDCVSDLSYGSDTRHRLDVYTSGHRSAKPSPVLIFVHGGGFLRGDKADRANVAYAFAQEGYVVVLPNYRLAPAHRWPAGAEDVAAVLQWVTCNAAQHGGDPARVILVGESAGAAHIATCMLLQRFAPSPACAPHAVALISGVYNARLESLARAQFGIATPDARNESYYGPDRAAWDGMSTIDLVDVAPFPLLITYAELDPPQMQVQCCELFARLVSRHGFQPALQVIRGHGHLSQLYSIGTEDQSLTGVLLHWAAHVRQHRR